MEQIENFLKEAVFLDTESTGLHNEAELCELGAAIFNIDFEIVDKYEELFGVDVPISPETSAVNSISQKMLEGKPKFLERGDEFPWIYAEYKIAHNADYDKKLVDKHLFSLGKEKTGDWICTLKLAKYLYPDEPSHKLNYYRYKFSLVPDDMISHRALNDVRILAGFFQKMLYDLIEREILDPFQPIGPQLLNIQERPKEIRRFPAYGKHAGKYFDEIPIDYWEWAVMNLRSLQPDNENYDKDFAYSVGKYLKGKI